MSQSVVVSYLHPGKVSHSFMDSLMRLQDYERLHGDNLYARFPVQSGVSLDKSRNVQVKVFLEQTECEWLWLVDADMGFKEDTLERLLTVDKSVVSGLYYAMMNENADGYGGWQQRKTPCVYLWDGSQFIEHGDTFEDEITQASATGAGCLLINRRVLEPHDSWFDYMYLPDGTRLGEDMSFFAKTGMSVAVHTDVKLSHHKEVWVT